MTPSSSDASQCIGGVIAVVEFHFQLTGKHFRLLRSNCVFVRSGREADYAASYTAGFGASV